MSLIPPLWIDNEYIQKSIQDGDENRQIVVRSFDISPAVPPGGNYGSELWRVNVEYQEDNVEDILNISMIVKAPVQDEKIRVFKDPILHEESCFYYELLPFLTYNSFAPKSFFSAVPRTIVMEDLSAQGYVMADRLKGLDFDECRLYAVASATFHAATVAAHNTNPELVESLGVEKMYVDHKPNNTIDHKQFVFLSVCVLADKMENMSSFKKYAESMRNYASTLWDELVEVHQRCETLNALGQGDPWITNMMFRYDSSGKANAIKLLDFQALRYSSPVADLVFFVWFSAGHEVREDHLEELYLLYCDTLNDKLAEFNSSERLPYDQLLALTKRFFSVVLYAAIFNPLLKSEEPFDFHAMRKKSFDDNFSSETLSNILSERYTEAYCKRELTRFLKQVESIGLFDYLKYYTQKTNITVKTNGL